MGQEYKKKLHLVFQSTSGRNIIQSGNLDVVLEYWDGDSYEEVTSTTKLFNDAALWEPGYTEVAYLKVSNAGSLALQYQLAVTVYNETLGKTKTGADIKLSDHLVFKAIESTTDLADTYTRETAMAAAGTEMGLNTYNGDVKALEKKGDADYLALIIYMPTTVGNEANHDGVNVPFIEMGVNLFATQFTYEEDSFDKYYDSLANPWSGAADISWYADNAEASEYIITTPEELAGFAAIVNGTANTNARDAVIDSFKGKTVKLGADIDLGNLQWTPIGDVDADDFVGFQGTFDGQGHTIYNLSIERNSWAQGLFGYMMDKGAVVKNFTVCNASVSADDTSAVIAGYATYGTFSNVHVTGDVKVEGTEHMGVIVGNGYFANFDNCSVDAADGSTITAPGSFVGGIVGYHGEGNLTIDNCSVKNITITGKAAVGGITGLLSASNTISSCSVENVVLNKTREGGDPAIGMIAGCYTYNANKPATIKGCVIDTIELNGNYEVGAYSDILHGSEYSGKTDANFVLEYNVAENVTNNLVELKKVSVVKTPEELQQVFADVTSPVVIDASAVTVDITTGDFFVIPGNVTLQGLTVNAKYRGHSYVVYDGENIVLENCIFGNTDRTLVLCGTTNSSSVTYNNCDFKGQVLTNFVDNTDGVAIFNDCTFTKSDSGGYHFIEAMGGTHQFKGCTFDYTGVTQTDMGTITNGQINVFSPGDGEYATTVELEGCTRINCGTRKYGLKSTLIIK